LPKLSKSFYIFSLAIILLAVIGVGFYQIGLTLQSQVTAFQTSNTDLQNQLNELQTQLEENSSNTSQTLQNYVNFLESQLETSNALSQQLQTQITSLENQVSTSTSVSQTLQSEVNDLESQLADFTALSQSLESQVSDLQAQLASSTALSQSLGSQVSDLETQLDSAETLSQTLQDQITSLEQQVTDLSDAILSLTPVATFDFLKDFTMEAHTSDYYQFPSDEYRTVTLVVYLFTPVTEQSELEVNVSFWVEGSSQAPIMDYFVVVRSQNATVVKTYDVIGSPFGFMITNPTDTLVEGRFTIYMSS